MNGPIMYYSDDLLTSLPIGGAEERRPDGLDEPHDACAITEHDLEAQHLRAETFSEPVIPTDRLAEPVQAYIQAVAESYGCPVDYVVASCLAAAGTAAGKKVTIVNNPYINYPCDFFCLVGKPGQNKSAPLKEVTRPLFEHDKSCFAQFADEMAIYDRNMKESGQAGKHPVFHQRVAVDSTPEARNALLAQGDMIITIADELKSFIDSFGRYAKGSNGLSLEATQLLSIWSNTSYVINRKTEETRFVEDPAMSIIGGIQPGLIGKTFGADALMDSGFNQRFLFVYPGQGKFISRRDRRPMTQDMRDSWKGRIGQLFSMEPMVLTLSEEARRRCEDYSDDNDMKADAASDEYTGTLFKKMNIHVMRLTAMLHLLSDNWNEPVMEGTDMDYAIRVADYFLRTHTERICPLLTGSRPALTMTHADLIRAAVRQFDVKSQSSLAEALGVSQQYISKTLRDERLL